MIQVQTQQTYLGKTSVMLSNGYGPDIRLIFNSRYDAAVFLRAMRKAVTK